MYIYIRVCIFMYVYVYVYTFMYIYVCLCTFEALRGAHLTDIFATSLGSHHCSVTCQQHTDCYEVLLHVHCLPLTTCSAFSPVQDMPV